jgi:hypothetical protein
MAQIIAKPKIELELWFKVNEAEARALKELSDYNVDSFLEHFYAHLGKCYMEQHEDGLRQFLTSVRGIVAGPLSDLDDARKVFNHTTKGSNP